MAKVHKLCSELQAHQCRQDEVTVNAMAQEQPTEVVKRKGRETAAMEGRRESELYEMIKVLREEVAELKKSRNNPSERVSKGRTSYRKGCRFCQERDEEERCEHCFKCGALGHAARGCRASKNPAEGRCDVKISTQSMRPENSASTGYSDSQELLRQRIRQLEAELEQKGKSEHAKATTFATHILAQL